MKLKHGSRIPILILTILIGTAILPTYNAKTDVTHAFSGLEEFGANVRITDDTSDLRAFPAMVVEDGTIYVVWQEKRDGDDDIYFSKSMNNGTTFSRNITVNDESGCCPTIQKTPDIAQHNNHVYVVWEDYRNGFADSDIFIAHSSDGGNSFKPSVEVNIGETIPGKDWAPSVAVDKATGFVYVAWVHGQQNNDIKAASSINEGKNFQTVTVSSSITNSRGAPDIAVDNNGKVYVVWKDGRNGKVYVDLTEYDSEEDVFIANSTDNGLSFGLNVVVNEPFSNIRQAYPSIAIDGNNDIHVAWLDARFAPKLYFVMYSSSSDGSNFRTNVLVNNSSPIVYGLKITDHQSPSIAVDPSGNNITIVWFNNRGGLNNNNIYMAKSTDGGQSFGPANHMLGGNYFIDSLPTYNGVYDDGEVVILDNGNDVLDPGTLNGTDSPDKVIVDGKASLIQDLAGIELVYNDTNSSGFWEFEEDIVYDAPLTLYDLVRAESKTVWDNTSSSNTLDYLWHADSIYYYINQSEVMGIDLSDFGGGKGLLDTDPISSVVVEIVYNTTSTYSGTSPVYWSLGGGANNSLFTIENTNEVDVYNSTDLYPLGIDTVLKIKTLNISFENNDINPSSMVKFDKLTLKVTRGFKGKYDSYDTIVYNGTFPVSQGAWLSNFSSLDGIVYMDSNNNGTYTSGEPIIKLSHEFGNLTENDTVLQPPNAGNWTTCFTPFPLNEYPNSNPESPSVAVDEWGNVYVVWKDLRFSQPGIYFTNAVKDSWPPEVVEIEVKPSYMKITFSEPVKEQTLYSAYSLNPDVAGTWTWNPYGYIVTLLPSQPFFPMTTYKLVITTDLEDLSGNHMLSDFYYSFKIHSLPTIIHSAVLAAEVKKPITIGARIMDGDGILNAAVFYKNVGEENYTQGNMNKTSGTTLDGYWIYNMPPTSNLNTINYYIEAVDVLGNDARFPLTGNLSIVLADVNPPVTQHSAIKDAAVSSEIVIEATVTDDLAVENVLLYIKPIGADNFNPPVVMTKNGDRYSAKVNVGDKLGILRYYIRAVDTYGNDGLSPQGGVGAPYEVQVYEEPFYIIVFSLQAVGILLILVQRFSVRKLRSYET